MTTAETRTCIFVVDPRGFLRAEMRIGCEMNLEDAKGNVAAIYELGGGTRNRVLVDMRGVRSQTREARQYFGGPEAAQATLAVGLLIGSPISRVLGNFFLRFGPHRVPTALFTEEQAAVAWLLEHPDARTAVRT